MRPLEDRSAAPTAIGNSAKSIKSTQSVLKRGTRVNGEPCSYVLSRCGIDRIAARECMTPADFVAKLLANELAELEGDGVLVWPGGKQP